MTGPTPIFVLGIQRSGTTFAANLLAAHPQIAAVTAERHQGVHESVFFSHFARMHGDWSDAFARRKAVAGFLTSDYFRLTGLDPAFPPITHQEEAPRFFCAVMDAFAAKRGARAWVEKSPHHTLLADEIAAAVPDARFLCVTRATTDFLASRLWSYGRTPPRYPQRAATILRACTSNVFHSRYLADFVARLGPSRAFLIEYSALQSDADATLAPLLNACGLMCQEGHRPKFCPNSSFSATQERSTALTLTDKLIARMSTLAAMSVPLWLLSRLQAHQSTRRPQDFPKWVWTLPPSPGQANEG